MNIKENYQQYVSRYASEVAALKRKNTGFITGELLAFGGILAFLICYFAIDGDTQNYLMGAALCLIAYLGIRRLDDKNKEKIEHLSALLKVYQDEIKALEGDFSPFETGDCYQNPQHPYSFDLDVFGKSSLFNRICRTITSGGSEALARNLTRETPLSLEDIKRRRDLQKELAGEGENWRMEFLALGEKNRSQTADGKMVNGKMKKIDSAAVVDAMQKVSKMEVPAWFGSPVSLVIGWLLIIGVIGSVILSICDMVSVDFALWWVLVQYMVVFFVCKQTLDKIDSNGGKLRHQLIAYAQILQLINRRNFHSESGKEMQNSLADALPSFAQLEKILKGYDRRGNFLGLFFTDAFMLSDFFLVRSFLKWKNTYMVKMEEWMHIISEMDAMVSMADFLAASLTRRPVWTGVGKKTRAQVMEALKMVEGEKLLHRPLGRCSGGELQRVLLALALHPAPDLLVLDEPVSGVDQNGLQMFLDTVVRLKEHHHMAILLVSHDLNVVRPYADHVVLLDDETKEICKEIVRCGGLDGRVNIALDYFDASINRISAWTVGFRNVQKALLSALLTPNDALRALQDEQRFTELMVRQEALKTMPFGDVWDEYCRSCNVPVGTDWFETVQKYERDVLSKRV